MKNIFPAGTEPDCENLRALKGSCTPIPPSPAQDLPLLELAQPHELPLGAGAGAAAQPVPPGTGDAHSGM